MSQPLLHVGNVRIMRQCIGGSRGTQRMHAEPVHVIAIYAMRSLAFLRRTYTLGSKTMPRDFRGVSHLLHTRKLSYLRPLL